MYDVYYIISSTLNSRCLITRCPCGKQQRFYLEATLYQSWKAGKLIQAVFPKMNPDDREMLISSICPKCWDELFKEPEEQESLIPNQEANTL